MRRDDEPVVSGNLNDWREPIEPRASLAEVADLLGHIAELEAENNALCRRLNRLEKREGRE